MRYSSDIYYFVHSWKEVMFLRFKYFGYLTEDKPEENEDQMRNDAFFCFRFVFYKKLILYAMK